MITDIWALKYFDAGEFFIEVKSYNCMSITDYSSRFRAINLDNLMKTEQYAQTSFAIKHFNN